MELAPVMMFGGNCRIGMSPPFGGDSPCCCGPNPWLTADGPNFSCGVQNYLAPLIMMEQTLMLLDLMLNATAMGQALQNNCCNGNSYSNGFTHGMQNVNANGNSAYAPACAPGGGLPPSEGEAGPIHNESDFARALLQRLGCPVTEANVQSIVKWEKREGGHFKNSAHFNPLNTTQGAPGATRMNSAGVKSYTGWEQGLEATVKTLRNGRYGDILAALQAGNGLSHGNYRGLSSWSGGGYSSI